MRARRMLVAVLLFAWGPMTLAAEVAATLPTLGMRGAPAVVELGVHALVAAIGVAAAWALWTGNPEGGKFAAAAIAAAAAAGIQSLFWTRLPSNTMAGDKLPLAALIAAIAAGCFLLVRSTTAP